MGNQASAGATMDFSQGLPNTEKTTERGASAAQKIQYAVSGMRGFRQQMEDQHLHYISVPVEGQPLDCLNDHAIFGVFDGHGGQYAALYCAKNFLRILSQRAELRQYVQLSKMGSKSRCDTNGICLLKHALGNSFLQLDAELIALQHKINDGARPERERKAQEKADATGIPQPVLLSERSGSTCVVVLVTPSHVICANAGDSRAFLRRNGNVLPLSFDHKPSDLPERMRIAEAGGIVKSKRVDGDLAVSRALGDFVYKSDTSKTVLQQKVIGAPDLTVYPRNHLNDEFIVLACDGVWDVASSEQASEFIQSLLDGGETDLGVICEECVEVCLERNSRDNITLLLVGLPGIKVSHEKPSLMMQTLWAQRRARRAKRFLTATACAASLSQMVQAAVAAPSSGSDAAATSVCATSAVALVRGRGASVNNTPQQYPLAL